MVKATILFAVLNSHEIVRRQILWFAQMGLPENVEVLIVDDGSNPPLDELYHVAYHAGLRRIRIYPTKDFRPWTQPMARNRGAEIAHGEYLICTDIDHIVTKDLINFVLNTDYDYVRFRRELGVLTEDIRLTQDHDELVKYGIPQDRMKLRLPAHGNSYAIKRNLFLKIGGSQQKERYPNQDEVPVKRAIKSLHREGKIKVIPDEDRPVIYMIPNGRFCGDRNYNPFNLFHDLKR